MSKCSSDAFKGSKITPLAHPSNAAFSRLCKPPLSMRHTSLFHLHQKLQKCSVLIIHPTLNPCTYGHSVILASSHSWRGHSNTQIAKILCLLLGNENMCDCRLTHMGPNHFIKDILMAKSSLRQDGYRGYKTK